MKGTKPSKKRASFFYSPWTLVFLTLWSIESHAMKQGTLIYKIEDYSPRAHQILQDHGESALYKVSLRDANTYLPWKEPIKRASTRLLSQSFSPARPVMKIVRRGIYRKRPLSRYSDAKDFFSSFHENVPYTYAVLKDKLVFAESTNFPLKEKYRDKFSKHSLISGLKKHVRYAGEFRVFKDSLHEQVVVVFDNASGTFRPASEHLPNLKQLLEHNFAEEGLHFVIRSFDQVINTEELFQKT